jgi:hypothetical protein
VTVEQSTWPRRHFRPGGGDAHIYYMVYGSFTDGLELSTEKYRCSGVPPGLAVSTLQASEHAEWMTFGTSDILGERLDLLGEDVSSRVRRAPACVVVKGTVEDPANLDYFRDCVGLVQALLESGGIAVCDPFMFDWWSPEAWSSRAFDPAGPVPRHHVVILTSPEDNGTEWFHTRGLVKFGRPDLSIRGVTPTTRARVIDLCNRFIELLAFGGVVPDGQLVRMAGLPEWTCKTLGDLDDPDFNNCHIEIG